jgi:ATP-dependent Clp protease ATP-binding subunit ClpB
MAQEAVGGLLDGADALLEGLPKAIGGSQPQAGPAFRNFLDLASDTARGLGDRFVATDAMLLAFANAATDAKKLLARFGLDRGRLETAIRDSRKGSRVEDERAEEKFASLEKYARDLTEAARAGKVDPVIGRDDEIRRVLQVLCRRTKNNPVLIGEPGVGKTAIVEGLASGWPRATCPRTSRACA